MTLEPTYLASGINFPLAKYSKTGGDNFFPLLGFSFLVSSLLVTLFLSIVTTVLKHVLKRYDIFFEVHSRMMPKWADKNFLTYTTGGFAAD